MRQIRNGVFETNSSSTHSVSVRCGKGLQQNWMPVGNDGYIHASLDEFGWEIETYRDQDAKLSYLLTMAYMKTRQASTVGLTSIPSRMISRGS